MTNNNGILKKSIGTFILIASAIFVPFQSLFYLKQFGYSNVQIFAGWSFLYLLILLIYATYSYFKQGKDYFKYSINIIQFIVILPSALFMRIMRFITNTLIGIFYLQYLGELIKQSEKTKTQREVERMGKIFKQSFKDLFNVPIKQNPKFKKMNKKGQALFIGLLVALLVILLILLYLTIVKK